MDGSDISAMISKIEKEQKIFSQKAYLDPLAPPQKIIGRKKQAEQLLRLLLSYKQGFVVPFVSVYGRSGSGKSVVTRFVCKNISDIPWSFVNLREAKTVFGAANLILGSLDRPSLKSAQGINMAIDHIEEAIRLRLAAGPSKLFLLVLDEFDVIFSDKRSRPSDFVYKLVLLAEKLRKDDILLCIISISNNVLSEYELDDRVKSRIGSTEIFFEPYMRPEILEILKERARLAFSKAVDGSVLKYCAELGSSEHGDARRAIDLLRVSAEIASLQGQALSKGHVELASEELQKDRADKVISGSSNHFKAVCGALARITYLSEESLQATSTIYKQYCMILQKYTKPLSYRRVSDLLVEIANTGLARSQTVSKGRHGYGTQYMLLIPPEMVGNAISEEWWQGIEKEKTEHDENVQMSKNLGTGLLGTNLRRTLSSINDIYWKKNLGL